MIFARLYDSAIGRTCAAAPWFPLSEERPLVQSDRMIAVLLVADMAFLHRTTTKRTTWPTSAQHASDIRAHVRDLPTRGGDRELRLELVR
jgi:hypothetical protein